MFLEQRSPLRVRVRSSKCELFFLKKIDAVHISTKYPNIWKNINKKSLYNYEQMKKNINKIVEMYCEIKTIQSNIEINSPKNKPKEKQKKYPKNIDTFRSGLKTIKEEDVKKKSTQSCNNKKQNYSKFFKNIRNDEELILDSNIFNTNKKRKYSYSNNIEREKIVYNFILNESKGLINKSNSYLSLLSISSNNKTIKKGKSFKNQNNKKNIVKKNSKIEQKVVGVNKNKNNSTIISEKSGAIEYQGIIQGQKLSKKSKILFSKIFKNSILNNNDTVKIDNCKEEENSKSEIYFNKEINNELHLGEIIKIANEENLLNKKANMNFIPNNQIDFNHNIIMNNNNKKIEKLLKYLNEETNRYNNNYKYDNDRKEKNEENYSLIIKDSNKNVGYKNENDSKVADIDPFLNKNQKLITWKYLSISNNMSFQFYSSYENFNVISGNKFIQNKNLQKKLKKYLLEEVNSDLEKNKNLNIKRLSNQNKFSELKNKFLIREKSNKKRLTIQNRNFYQKKKEENFGRGSCILKKCGYNASINYYENNSPSKSKLEKNIFQSRLEPELGKNLLPSKIQKRISISQEKTPKKVNFFINHMNINNSFLDSQEGIKSCKNENKKTNLLSKINFNIQRTNQNLNNPEEFYSNYFNSILERKLKY